MEYIRILTCKAMTTDEIWVRILIYNDCGTEKFLNVFFPVTLIEQNGYLVDTISLFQLGSLYPSCILYFFQLLVLFVGYF